MSESAFEAVVAASLLLLVQCGFALTISGFVRARSAVHAMVAVVQLSAVAIVGFCVLGGSVEGGAAPLLHGLPVNSPIFERYLLLALVAAVAAVIPAGALAERWHSTSMIVTGAAVSSTIFPLAARWIWSGGWMAQLWTYGLGHGVVDFAGSGVVHVVGGAVALAGAAVLGPRSRKFTRDGRPMAMPGHQVPTLMAGSLTFSVGWIGLLLSAAILHPPDAGLDTIVNTLLSASASVLAATAWMRYRLGTPDPSLVSNALVAGLVSSAAGCAFVSAEGALLTGAVAGPLVVSSVLFLERRMRLDDPTGAISVHGVCGAWGLVAVGLFANGQFGEGWNGAAGRVTGLLYGSTSQLPAQAIGLVLVAAFAGGLAFVLFQGMEMTIGNRVSADAEVEGLDVAELGTVAYRDFGVEAPSRSSRR
jgi:ammonium transporter, Amt family